VNEWTQPRTQDTLSGYLPEVFQVRLADYSAALEHLRVALRRGPYDKGLLFCHLSFRDWM
jgi:hypothetical protein